MSAPASVLADDCAPKPPQGSGADRDISTEAGADRRRPDKGRFSVREADFSRAALLAEALQARLGSARAEDVIAAGLETFGEGMAMVSSFGAESAVLLHLAAQVDTSIPVLFLDTGKLFGETKRYRDTLANTLGLTNVITLSPDDEDISLNDPKGMLFDQNANHCCFIRKVIPLNKALKGYEAWASGRKRFQADSRSKLDHFESEDGKVKINPLALWTREDVRAYAEANALPAHPLVAEGFKSIGCMPCTDRVQDGESERAGRWRGKAKTECGIHLSLQENARILDGATAHLS